jgi:hypothetical protein
MTTGPDRSTFPPAARAAAAVLALVLVFALGVWWGRGAAPEHVPAASASPSTTPTAGGTVELRLDAGALTLLPEGGLELRPMPSLDPLEKAPTPSATP